MVVFQLTCLGPIQVHLFLYMVFSLSWFYRLLQLATQLTALQRITSVLKSPHKERCLDSRSQHMSHEPWEFYGNGERWVWGSSIYRWLGLLCTTPLDSSNYRKFEGKNYVPKQKSKSGSSKIIFHQRACSMFHNHWLVLVYTINGLTSTQTHPSNWV